MQGVVSPLRVTLILIVPHLQLKRVGIRSLSSHTIYYEPIICQLSLLLEPIFLCTCVRLYYARTILQHTWALSSESSDSTQGFTRSPYIRISYALHYYLCFHASQILYVITMNMIMRASEEYCETLQ